MSTLLWMVRGSYLVPIEWCPAVRKAHGVLMPLSYGEDGASKKLWSVVLHEGLCGTG